MEKVEKLIKQGLIDSALLLSSSLGKDGWIGYAQCLFLKQEYKRSMYYYDKILQPKRHLSIEQECKLRQDYAKACLECQELDKAKQIMERIPQQRRSVFVLVQLGKLYELSGDLKSSIESYRSALLLEPLAVEAELALIRLHNFEKEVKVDKSFISKFILAVQEKQQNQFQDCYKTLTTLDKEHPQNVHILLEMADCALREDNRAVAYCIFTQIRKIDPHVAELMDMFAELLQKKNETLMLNKLADELIKYNPNKPQGWLALARYHDMKNEKEKAIEFTDHAISLDCFHVQSYVLKGFLLLSMNKTKRVYEALSAFRKAYRLCKEISLFEGIAKSYLALAKHKEALAAAKEAMTFMPKNPRSFNLLGICLLGIDGKREQAKSCFLKALSIHSKNVDAALALSSVYAMESDYSNAIQTLESLLKEHPSDVAHAKLGDFYVIIKDYTNGLLHYNTALSINQDCQLAKEGAKRIERLLSGAMNDEDSEMEERTSDF